MPVEPWVAEPRRSGVQARTRSTALSPSPARIRSTVASVVDQPDDLRQIRLFHRALADVNRLRIIQRLADGSATVTELIEHVGLSQPLVSWHLGKLRASGIVTTARAGRETICSLRPSAFAEAAIQERDVLGVAPRP
ncbi:MAG: ArsR/SmtB family transcription factor [Candidatus Limnocylindrales bacterium]|jgi:DNA-binding transcriptional ArsR family regulator